MLAVWAKGDSAPLKDERQFGIIGTFNYTDGTRTFTWQHGRQLATLTKGGVTWTYTYNADGLRTKRTNGTTTYNYVYNGDKLSQMTIVDVATGAKEIVDLAYDAGGLPMTLTYTAAGATSSTTYYYVTNIQGDVVGLTDSQGTLLIRYAYEAYGKGYYASYDTTQAALLARINPLSYRGYVLDTGTGLYYLQSRYYDPVLGRFLNADALTTTGQGFIGNNMFAYCLNNPVNRYDPNGMSSHNAAEPWKCTCVDCFDYSSGGWGIVTDSLVTYLATASTSTGNIYLFGAINNTANFVYYTWISDGKSSLELDTEKSTYVNTYISRWDRLDYTKQETGNRVYGFNAWRYNSEYSMHMYGWYALLPFKESKYTRIQEYRTSLRQIHIEPHLEDTNWKTRIVTYLFGLLGL